MSLVSNNISVTVSDRTCKIATDESLGLFQRLSGRHSACIAYRWSQMYRPDRTANHIDMPGACLRVDFDEQGARTLCSPVIQFALQYLRDKFGSLKVVSDQNRFRNNILSHNIVRKHAKNHRITSTTEECRRIWVLLARVRANNGIADSQPYSRWRRIIIAWHERAQKPARRIASSGTASLKQHTF